LGRLAKSSEVSNSFPDSVDTHTPSAFHVARMCGRYSQTKALAQLKRRFPFATGDTDFLPRFNIAPTQDAPVIRNDDLKTLKLMKWGLIPFWARDLKAGYKMINARAEGIAEKPAYRDSFRRKRCLVIADGFYEWKKTGQGKIPHRFEMRDQESFAFAGLWDSATLPEQSALETFTIITTAANDLCRHVHDRMPVILQSQDYDQWLDPKFHRTEALLPLLCSCPAELMTCYPVSTLVNNSRNDMPQCAERISFAMMS